MVRFNRMQKLQQTIDYYLREAKARSVDEEDSNMYRWQAEDTMRLVIYLEKKEPESYLIHLIEETPFRDVQQTALEILHNPEWVNK